MGLVKLGPVWRQLCYDPIWTQRRPNMGSIAQYEPTTRPKSWKYRNTIEIPTKKHLFNLSGWVHVGSVLGPSWAKVSTNGPNFGPSSRSKCQYIWRIMYCSISDPHLQLGLTSSQGYKLCHSAFCRLPKAQSWCFWILIHKNSFLI